MDMKNICWIFLLLLLPFFWSCDQNTNQEDITGETMVDTTAYNRQLDLPREEVILLPEVRELTVDWLAFVTAESEIRNFDNYTVNDVISNATPIAEIMNSLRETLPDSLKATAVESRLAVLYTKGKILEQRAQRRTTDPEEIANIAEQIPRDFNNFKIQLNELFLKTIEDFELELDLADPEEETEEAPTPPPAASPPDTII